MRRGGALLAMAMAGFFLGAALSGCQPYDPGGDVRSRIAAAIEARRAGSPVEIRGECDSACALKLASGRRVCIDRGATIGVHEVRSGSRLYANGERDDMFTGFFEALLPACAQRLFAAGGAFDGGDLVRFSGQQVLSACPQFTACPG
jgi:hypothetical protein